MKKKYMTKYIAPYFLAAFSALLLTACGAGTAQNNTKMEENQKLTADTTKPDTTKPDSAKSNTAIVENPQVDTTPKTAENEELSKDFLMGKFDPAKDARYVMVKPPLSNANLYVHKETLAAFEKMRAAAQKDGISLTIISGVRNFNAQKSIWEAKWESKRPVDGNILPPIAKLNGAERAKKILLWNSMPGTSRHHWGTDIDMNSVSPAYFNSGKGKKEYEWLQANAATFGFCQTYSTMVKENPKNEERTTGYQEEKWHWSYTPLAKKFTEAYGRTIKNKDIKGFLGDDTPEKIDIVKNYVLGINPKCK
jgi:LAS superfamily LD-carboxypeptidase LdcB